MASYATSRAFKIVKNDGNARVAVAGHYADIYCPPAGAITQTLTMVFSSFQSAYEIPRFGFDGTFDTTAAINTNITSSAFYLNGALVSGPTSFVAGDSLLVRAVVPVASGTIVVAIEYATSAALVLAAGYLWERWENLQNAAPLANEYEETINSIVSDNIALAYNKGANGSYRATGACRIEFRFDDIRLSVGLSKESTITYPATLWNRIYHCWVIVYPNATCRTLGATESGAATLPGITPQTQFAIEDTGSSVIYQYRHDPNGTWTTHYTSSRAYIPNTVWHSDACMHSPNAIFKGVKLYGEAIV
jgi:hypothetical protein